MTDRLSTVTAETPIRLASEDRALEIQKAQVVQASAQDWQDPSLTEFLFKENQGGLIAGSVPYRASNEPISLFCSENPRWIAKSQAQLTAVTAQGPRAQLLSLRESPSRERFLGLVERALTEIETSPLDKVVLSRSHHLSLSAKIDPNWLFARLIAKQKRGYVFQVPYQSGHRKGVLVGASPELLLSRYGSLVRSTPLAGSLPRSLDPEENRRRARRLLSSKKDLHEHRLVVEHIRSCLSDLCTRLEIPQEPSIVSTPTMLHLGTPIEGQLKSSAKSTHALALALRLHPTPALCGVPVDRAQALIANLEPEDRELYGGTVGWMDAHGNGEWAVTIRCAHIEGTKVRLQAGVGIVRGSSPELELLETDAKIQTMLRALGLAPARQPNKAPRRPEIRP